MAGLTRLLNERDDRLRSRARAALEDLRAELSAFGATAEDLETLRQAARDLDELFLLVIVGEFNSGKSAMINALLGADLLEEGVTPTTSCINILRHGEARSERWLSQEVLEREYDAPLLQDVAVVDTPGTNAILRGHQELTERFIPRSDLVLFVTSVERPFTESERAFLEAIRGWGKKVVLVLNKTDLMRNEEELRQVTQFVDQNVQALLGFSPRVFPISARKAREARLAGEALTPILSQGESASGEKGEAARGEREEGFEALERFIRESLDTENRVKLKLSSPLGVAGRVAERYEAVARHQLALLAEDDKAGRSIESQLAYYRDDMRLQFASRLQQVENQTYELADRGDRFFEETLRLGRIFDLINAEKIRGEFQRQVVANSAERIEESVDALANWTVDREVQLWQGVTEELARRRKARPGEVILGEAGTGFESRRHELIQSVTRSARRVVAGFDREAEAKALGTTMREAVAHTALAEVGALGFGTLMAVLVGTAAADVSGILAGSLMAGLGLYIIPARRQKVQKQFRQRTDELRVKLRESLSQQLNAELDASMERLQTAVAPYFRFVRSEQEKVHQFHDRLARLQEEMGALGREIGSPSFERDS